jgi:hypothetical protein
MKCNIALCSLLGCEHYNGYSGPRQILNMEYMSTLLKKTAVGPAYELEIYRNFKFHGTLGKYKLPLKHLRNVVVFNTRYTLDLSN